MKRSLKFVSLVNNEAVLQSSLCASPTLHSAGTLALCRGATSAAIAYNKVIQQTSEEILIFIHQDVYLPYDWVTNLEKAIDAVEVNDPSWGVLGLFGVDAFAKRLGWLYSTGLGEVVGSAFSSPQPVRTLDEVVLVVRRSSGLTFDEALVGFHMYGTDICLEAERRGMNCYAVPAFAIHNSNGIRQLPWSFWKSCAFVRTKWKNRLPIVSPCTIVSRNPFLTARQMLERFIRFNLLNRRAGNRVSNPAALYDRLNLRSATTEHQ